jgi:hypothetical protein
VRQPQEDPACWPRRLGGRRRRSSVPGNSTWVRHYVAVGSKGDKPRKPKHRLPKVPKYEEPNTLPLPGLVGGASAGPGPAGDGGNHQHSQEPGRAGKVLLWLLGRRPKDPNPIP